MGILQYEIDANAMLTDIISTLRCNTLSLLVLLI